MSELLWDDVCKRIKQVFYNAGITDDLGILEPLGFFLLGLYKGVLVETGSLFEVDPEQTQYILEKNFPDSELPHPPSFGRGSFDKKLFARLIVDLISSINNEKLGRFYEYCITNLITEIKTGGRYTTPRHVTKFLGSVAELEPKRSLADFASSRLAISTRTSSCGF